MWTETIFGTFSGTISKQFPELFPKQFPELFLETTCCGKYTCAYKSWGRLFSFNDSSSGKICSSKFCRETWSEAYLRRKLSPVRIKDLAQRFVQSLRMSSI